MELFHNAKTVRLKSHHKKYLLAHEDEKSVIQDRNGSSKDARWTLEPVPGLDSTIRLKSAYNKYLTASNHPFLLGMTGSKVLQTIPQRLDSSIEWELVLVGSHVKLKTVYGQFLRANGGLPPWRNSVTHDIPQQKATLDWVLWDVDITEIQSPVAKPATSKPTTSKPRTSRPTSKPMASKPSSKPTASKPASKLTTSRRTSKPTTSRPKESMQEFWNDTSEISTGDYDGSELLHVANNDNEAGSVNGEVGDGEFSEVAEAGEPDAGDLTEAVGGIEGAEGGCEAVAAVEEAGEVLDGVGVIVDGLLSIVMNL